ncbi:oxygen-independent coproporphyrinogen III oxidase [Panacibacter microcysteis]|nr:oxygen-independent coproporphyrinogen III oxidase [Panacibacter microcysteis]
MTTVMLFGKTHVYFRKMKSVAVLPALIEKYNKPLPRYTSYPTVPYWEETIDAAKWAGTFSNNFIRDNNDGISIYIHLPFCESLCTYCGCNKKITTNHKVEETYIPALEKEWSLYKTLMHEKPCIREIHLGGGTPTFFSPANLERIITTITAGNTIHEQHEFSIEGHPNNTTKEHLEVLYRLGFRRVSFGVQDNDPLVQHVINRVQPFENVQRAITTARHIGYTSVNFDLIYGLPKQTTESITRTIQQVIELKPDRIAFYSYAHVPWTSRAQRLFDEDDLPGAAEKMALYLTGKQLLTEAGYYDIGMDHFSLPHDDLYKARIKGKLHRNFMGYTTQSTNMLVGLGVSAISDAGTAFAQNEKKLDLYYLALEENRLPVRKGYFLNEEDLDFKQNIRDLSCHGRTSFKAAQYALLQEYSMPALEEFEHDGLLTYDADACTLTQQGHYFIRNICSAFDLHLQRSRHTSQQMFSKAI